MKKEPDKEQIIRDFKKRQDRQILAMAAAMFVVLLCAVIYKRPAIFGQFSKEALFAAESIVIAAFIGFTAVNWRCPACKKYLGRDVHRTVCKKCGVRLC